MTSVNNLEVWGLQLVIASTVFGLTIHHPLLWPYRKFFASIQTILIGTSTGLLITYLPPPLLVPLLVLQTYRLFSVLRIVEDRTSERKLRFKTLRSEVFLSLYLVVLLGFNAFIYKNLDLSFLPWLIVFCQFLAAVVFYRHTKQMFNQTKLNKPRKFLSDQELPTVTIAIPARNETADLTDCLQSVLASNYPKLEVLVADDCSQDKTSDIIKSFAHRGVRFVKGTPPPSSWIAKNHAYNQLLKNASGDLILFCGTDVRFDQDSLRMLINIFVHDKLSMASVLPIRPGNLEKHFLLQPMRYWRELVIPQTYHKTPPVLSTCWIADRKMLVKHGGFEGLRQAVRPERYIARGVALKGNYRFLRASAGLNISSVKSLRGQWDTATRTRYPELHNRPEAVLFVSTWQLVLLIGPLVSLAYAAYTLNGILAGFALLAYLYLLASHFYVHLMTTTNKSLLHLLLYPISVVLELVVINFSMWAYEFSEVIWKGRNVCLPVLRVASRLPEISERAANS